MKIIQKILAALGGLVLLFILLILLCYFKPELASRLGGVFSTIAQKMEQSKEAGDEAGNIPDGNVLNEVVTYPQSGTDIRDIPENLEGVLPTVIAGGDSKYQPVDASNLVIPDNRKNLGGYEPVADQIDEPSEDEIARIEEEVGYGETGDELSFDETMYPYYAMLDDTGKHLYRQLYANLNALTKEYKPIEQTTQRAFKNVFLAVFCDHPELFFANTSYGASQKPDGTLARIIPSYNMTAGNLEGCRSEFEDAVSRLIDGAQSSASDYEKELFVHDALEPKVVYNLGAPMNQSAYSALVNGATVCAGYARAFQYAMQKLGVPCYYVTGFAGENHAWNMIKLDDGYYNVDTTWDDTNPMTHTYFNGTDTDFSKDHVRKELSVYLPACNGEKYRLPIQDEESAALPQQTDNTPAADDAGDVPSPKEPEPPVERTGPRSITETSMKAEDMVNDVNAYFDKCYQACMRDSDQMIWFQVLVDSESTWTKIYEEYANGNYENAYINRVLNEKDRKKCQVKVNAERLEEGYYLIDHTISFSSD